MNHPSLFPLLVRSSFVPVSGYELLTFHLKADDFSPLGRCVLNSRGHSFNVLSKAVIENA